LPRFARNDKSYFGKALLRKPVVLPSQPWLHSMTNP